MPPAPRVLLVRHGETELNRLLCCQGWTDAPLNERGRQQAEAVAAHLSRRNVVRVVASPLVRARETAEAIARRHGLEVELHTDLRELHHGALEGVPFAELDDHVPGIRHAWRTAPHTVHMPGGESLADLQRRAAHAFDEVTRRHLHDGRNGGPYGDLVLVAHALTIGTLLCHAAGHGLDRLRMYRLQHCGFWELRPDGDAWTVLSCRDPMPEDTAV